MQNLGYGVFSPMKILIKTHCGLNKVKVKIVDDYFVSYKKIE